MLCTCAVLLATVSVAGAQDVAGIMKRVAERYRNLDAYRLEGSYEISNGQRLSGAKYVVAGTQHGLKRHVEYKGSNFALALITDGSTTWMYLPESKQYSRIEAAAKDDDADDQPEQEGDNGSPVDTLYTFLITHYSTFDKLAPASSITGEADVKTAEGKVRCWIIVTRTRAQTEKSWVDQERFVVLRSETVFGHEGVSPHVTLTTKRFDLEPQEAAEFAFEPRPKDKLVEELQIPGAAPSFVGKPAVDFQLKDVNGEPVRLSELRGRVVVLDFWATWCGPCRRELPTINKLAAEFKPHNVMVLGINDEGGSTVKNFNKKYQYTFTTLEDASGKVHRAYVARAIPSVFVIGKDGVIVKHFVGAREEAQLRAGIQAALAR